MMINANNPQTEDQNPSFSLEDITIATPCLADWDKMTGDHRVRFCGDCKMNVYNLSGMSRQKAEALVQAKEGRLCVQFLKRADGTIITKDCPVALHQKRIQRTRKNALVTVSVITLIGSFVVFSSPASTAAELLPKCKGVQTDTIPKDAIQVKGRRAIRGEVEIKKPLTTSPEPQYFLGTPTPPPSVQETPKTKENKEQK